MEINFRDPIEFFKFAYNKEPSKRFVELYKKMSLYSNTYFPIVSFLLDIEIRRDENFLKEQAFDDLEKMFDCFIQYYYDCEKAQDLNKVLITKCLEGDNPLLIKNSVYRDNADECYIAYKNSIGLGLEGVIDIHVPGDKVLTEDEYNSVARELRKYE